MLTTLSSMNAHTFLLAFLIGAGLPEASTSSGATAFAIPPALPSFRSTQRRTGRARQHEHGDAFARHYRASARPSPLTTVQARRGGRGRRRGRTDGGGAAAAAAGGVAASTPAGGTKEKLSQGTAAEATLAVQHASTEVQPRSRCRMSMSGFWGQAKRFACPGRVYVCTRHLRETRIKRQMDAHPRRRQLACYCCLLLLPRTCICKLNMRS